MKERGRAGKSCAHFRVVPRSRLNNPESQGSVQTFWFEIAAGCLNGCLLEEPILLSDSEFNDAGILAHHFYAIQFPQLL